MRSIEEIEKSIKQRFLYKNPTHIWSLLRSGVKPSNDMIMDAVKQNGSIIAYLLLYRIMPSDEVLIISMQKDYKNIYTLLKHGIEPSKAVKEAAILSGWLG